MKPMSLPTKNNLRVTTDLDTDNVVFFSSYSLFHSDSLVRISFYIPIWAFAIGLAVVLLTSVLSVMLAYLSFKRRSAPVFTGKAVSPAVGVEQDDDRNEIFDSEAR